MQFRRRGFNPWVGKIPWRREGYPFQYSGLENSMDWIVCWVTKSRMWLPLSPIEHLPKLTLYLTCMCVCLIMSDPLRPHELEPTRLLCPWNFLGKNTGVDCHFLLQRIFRPRDRPQASWLYLLHWQADSLPREPPGKPPHDILVHIKITQIF